MGVQTSLKDKTYGLLADIYYNNMYNCRKELLEETKNMVIRYLDLENYRGEDLDYGNNTLREYRGFNQADMEAMLRKHFNELREVLAHKLNNIPSYRDFVFKNSGSIFKEEIYPVLIYFIDRDIIEDLSGSMERESIIIKNMIFKFEREKSKV